MIVMTRDRLERDVPKRKLWCRVISWTSRREALDTQIETCSRGGSGQRGSPFRSGGGSHRTARYRRRATIPFQFRSKRRATECEREYEMRMSEEEILRSGQYISIRKTGPDGETRKENLFQTLISFYILSLNVFSFFFFPYSRFLLLRVGNRGRVKLHPGHPRTGDFYYPGVKYWHENSDERRGWEAEEEEEEE